MFKIRKALPEDSEKIQEIFYITWLDTYPNKDFGISIDDIEEKFKDRHSPEKNEKMKKKILDSSKDSIFMVAENEKEEMVGVCGVSKDLENNYLRAVYVLPDFQKKGIGYLFWAEAKKFFDTDKDILVNVASYNSKAVNFYKRLGFEISKDNIVTKTHLMPVSKVYIPEISMEIKKSA